MSELPDGWIKVPLGEVNGFSGSTVNPASRPDELFELYSVPSFPTGKPERLLGSEIGSTKQTVKAGDVLISKINPRINRVWTVGPKSSEEQIASSEWIGFRSEAVRPAFANYYFRSQEFRDLLCSEVAGVGGSLTRAQPKRVAAYPLPIAPLAEQTRIADQLDTLLARVNACNDHLDAIPGILKRFRQAVLGAACSGALTEQWRTEQGAMSSASELCEALEADHAAFGGHERGNASEPTQEAHDLTVKQLPQGWAIATLRECCAPGRPITYGILKPGPELDVGVPYIRVADFPGNKLNLSSIKKTSPEIDLQYKRARLAGGDLLLSIRGSVGRLIVIPPSLEGANITQDTARLSISSRLNARYVYYALLSPDAQRRMSLAIRGVAVRGINIGDVRALQVPLPPMPEQLEIARRVDELFALADMLEARWNKMRRAAQRLPAQVLAKAFRGELVEQDSQDEPASVLLQRLAATTSAKAPSSRGRPRAQPQVPATLPAPQAPTPIDWHTLPNNDWAAPAAAQDQAITACLTAVLKAWGQPMPELEARLATLLCQQPRVLTTVLPAAQAKEWVRLVGDEAKPLPAQVARLQPVSNSPWGQAIKRMRARGDLVEAGSADGTIWSLGQGASAIITTGWPDGRAAFVVAYLRTRGVASILPALAPADQAFVHVRAA